MKQYILKLSLAALCMFGYGLANAQEVNDSTKQELIDLPFGKVTKDRLVGAVEVISSQDLNKSSLPFVTSAMEGKTMGYVLGQVRGYSRGNYGDDPLIIIDGLSNRSIGSLTIEEIESIHVLKDVSAKLLYGSRAANGVIVIKTKRGYNGQKQLTFSGEYGIRQVKKYPEFLGAADYMKYRNQALLNDKKDAIYEPEDINLAGMDYKHPDVDFYDMFVNNQSSYQKANAQLVGGDDKTKYFFNLGWLAEDGLEKVGDKQKVNSLNVRSNLDYKVNEFISVNLDIAGRFYQMEGNHIGNGVFSALSSTKPNDYPVFISDAVDIDSLGTSDKVGGSNLYGEMALSGYRRDQVAFAQTNIGMNFDFNKYVKGLSAKAYATFDVNNAIAEGKNLSYRTLKPALTAALEDTLIVNGVYNPKGNEQKFSDTYYRNMGGGAYINYDKEMGEHALSATLSYLVEQKSVKTNAAVMSTVQDDKSMNFGFRLNYAYQNKYIAEVSSSYMGSSRFYVDNRWKMYNAFGVSYVISEEDFMDNVSFVDYLKVKASFGTIGYDQSFDYLLYNNYYKYWAGNYDLGVKNSDDLIGTEYIQSGNRDLTFEESKEMNIGISAALFGNKLSIEAELYKEERSGMPTLMRYAFPMVTGAPSIVANYNAIENKGIELGAQYSSKIGDLEFSFGGKYTSFESKWSKFDELNDFSFENVQGTATDAIWGYEADGFYTSLTDIETYGKDVANDKLLTSSLGRVIPGDLKYKNISNGYSEYTYNDNVINQYDQKIIGNSRPRYAYSVNLNLKYKNLSFYALGTGVGGFDRMNNWMTYFTNKGNPKYSPFVYDAAVPTFDAEGNANGLEETSYSLPRLTTEGSAHSYMNSTFWKKKGYYFNLRTIQLDYKLPESISSKIAAKSLNVYAQADNVFTISDEKDLDPINRNAGLSGSPRFTTVSLGLKLGF